MHLGRPHWPKVIQRQKTPSQFLAGRNARVPSSKQTVGNDSEARTRCRLDKRSSDDISSCFLATEVTESTENCAGQMPESDTYLCVLCGKITPTTTLNQFKTDSQVEMPLGQIPRWIRHFSNCFPATEVTESTEDLAGQMPKSDAHLCELCNLGGKIPPTTST
jgi:hypothetical protein